MPSRSPPTALLTAIPHPTGAPKKTHAHRNHRAQSGYCTPSTQGRANNDMTAFWACNRFSASWKIVSA
jgi:hypothetical protein